MSPAAPGLTILEMRLTRYPVRPMQSTARIAVHLMDSDERPTGVGEVAVPTTAPARANAVAALTATRLRGSDQQVDPDLLREDISPAMAHVSITPSENGPYLVSGPVQLTDVDGREIPRPNQMALCRCGHSGNKPFCDGTP